MYAKLLVPDHRLSLVVPRSSPEVYGIAVSLIGVERIGLETDLVRRPRVRGTAPHRRPRVRGTAPLATVGKERRLSNTKMRSSSGCLALPLFGVESVALGGGLAYKTSGRWFIPSSAVYLVDPASSHMLVSKIKPCKCQHMPPNG